MLGINITNNFVEFNKEQITKIDRFFDALQKLNVHPEIIHMILHFSGKPKMLYYCETTPPEFSGEVVKLFDERAKKTFSDLIGIEDESLLKEEMLHDVCGGNIPNYYDNREELYNNRRIEIENRGTSSAYENKVHMARTAYQVSLTRSNIEKFCSPECSHDRQWTHFIHESRVDRLSPKQYTTALAIRCGLAPDSVVNAIGPSFRCECNVVVHTRNQLAEHLCHCNLPSKFTFAHRHTNVKIAMMQTFARYGVMSKNEPNIYSYNNGLDCRPDITIQLRENAHVATDITIVLPKSLDYKDAGVAAATAAAEKIKKHAAATNNYGHVFIPFALETTGHFDPHCKTLMQMVIQEVGFHRRRQFVRDFYGSISVALAKYRADSLLSASERLMNTRNVGRML